MSNAFIRVNHQQEGYHWLPPSSFVGANLDQVIVRIVHIKSWRWASRAGLNARPQVITDGVKRVAVRDALFPHPGECFIKVLARQSERQMFISASAPRRQL